MNILIKKCNLISMDEKREKYEDGIDILIENDLIKKIGKNIDCETQKVIDAEGKIVMPGLINTHAHIPMSIFRETVDGYELQDWLTKKIWPVEAKLTEQDIYNATILSCKEMIKTGTTTVNDQYFMSESIIKAAIETGIRIELTRTLLDSDGNGEIKIKQLEDLISKYNNKYDTVTINVGAHGLYTCSELYVQKAIEIAEKYNLNLHVHFCENTQEVKDIKHRYNVEYPAEVLVKYFKNVNTILAHAVKLTDRDIEMIRAVDANVAHCPVSNLKLGCGIARVQEMIDKGINVSLGTDGQGSGSNLDMFEAMKFAALLQKGINESPKDMPAYQVIKMATINGAKTLGMEDKIGSIEVGKKADLIILDLDTEVTMPINDVFADIVYNAKGTNVITTIVNGNILMENRQI